MQIWRFWNSFHEQPYKQLFHKALYNPWSRDDLPACLGVWSSRHCFAFQCWALAAGVCPYSIGIRSTPCISSHFWHDFPDLLTAHYRSPLIPCSHRPRNAVVILWNKCTHSYRDSTVLNNGAASSLISKGGVSVSDRNLGTHFPSRGQQLESLSHASTSPNTALPIPGLCSTVIKLQSYLKNTTQCKTAKLKISQPKQIICSAFPTSPSLMSDPHPSLNLVSSTKETHTVLLCPDWSLTFLTSLVMILWELSNEQQHLGLLLENFPCSKLAEPVKILAGWD